MSDSRIDVRIGDLFESNVQTLVNTVNTEGVMGKGVALQFKKRFPDMYEDYVRRCGLGEVRLGRPYIYKERLYPWIINFPTKRYWRSVSQLSDIVAGLEYLEEHYRQWGVTSLAVPPLGCGEGGLEWRVVGRVLYRYLSQFEAPVALYAPFGTPNEQLSGDFLNSNVEPFDRGPVRLPPAWVAIVEILKRLEREPYRHAVGRTMFQKLAYFATEAGLPTNLEYSKGSFGPFASQLKRLQARLMQNGLLTETPRGRGGRLYEIEVGPAYDDAVHAYRAELDGWNDPIDRVADLMLRFDSLQSEIAATVHFAATRLVKAQGERPTEMEVLDAVRTWKMRRKPPLKEQDVARMVRNLNLLHWLGLEYSEDLPLPEHTFVDEFELQQA